MLEVAENSKEGLVEEIFEMKEKQIKSEEWKEEIRGLQLENEENRSEKEDLRQKLGDF